MKLLPLSPINSAMKLLPLSPINSIVKVAPSTTHQQCSAYQEMAEAGLSACQYPARPGPCRSASLSLGLGILQPEIAEISAIDIIALGSWTALLNHLSACRTN